MSYKETRFSYPAKRPLISGTGPRGGDARHAHPKPNLELQLKAYGRWKVLPNFGLIHAWQRYIPMQQI